MTSLIRYPAPAKLNLFLHVVGRRANGYHLLQTVFTFIDRCDYLSFALRDDGVVERTSGPDDIPPEQDLCVRAARLLRAKTRTVRGVSISLEKHLPTGAGLGGGSSDAATTLIVLNRLWNLNLSRERLQEIALELGADVPVFVFGQSAFAEGMGEQLTAITVPHAWYVVLTPPVHVATLSIFADPDLTRNSIPIKILDFSSALLRNDLEPVAKRHHGEIKQYLQWLDDYAPARMTGSGGAVFASFGRREDAQRVFDAKPEAMQGFIAAGWQRHPLAEF
ncbi:MAG: 4-(cytidine 5'-diphospho)-2-C-methyl-D-erythritol kinase [Burkholderiales bacterium]